jgi:hypothetical protein
MCEQTIRDGALVCVVQGAHDTHVFHSTSGVPDAPKEEM